MNAIQTITNYVYGAEDNFQSVLTNRLREVLAYDAATGIFRWKVARRCVVSGVPAGSTTKNGYIGIVIDRRRFYAHRLAILFAQGALPERGMDVDHIDGNRTNNAIANLRVVTHTTNLENRKAANRRSSGRSSVLLGVSWKKDRARWVANISSGRKTRHLGYFDTELAAHEAYVTAKRAAHQGNTI